MSNDPEDAADDFRPRRPPSGLCACDRCNEIPIYPEESDSDE